MFHDFLLDCHTNNLQFNNVILKIPPILNGFIYILNEIISLS